MQKLPKNKLNPPVSSRETYEYYFSSSPKDCVSLFVGKVIYGGFSDILRSNAII